MSGNALRILNPAQNIVQTSPQNNHNEKNSSVPTNSPPETADTNVDEMPEDLSDFQKKIREKAAQLSKKKPDVEAPTIVNENKTDKESDSKTQQEAVAIQVTQPDEFSGPTDNDNR